jgi:ribulose-5-phosphate 4-epimerase/fuculose-1-phosphate aldolase
MKINSAKNEFIHWSHLLYERGLVVGKSGNMSAKIGPDRLLVTVTSCYLGMLTAAQVALVDEAGHPLEKGQPALTSEKELHLGIYQKFPKINAVIHAHPVHTVAFFNYFKELDIFSFESRLNLGQVPVVPQTTPTVTKVQPVLAALEKNNLVVLKNHGVVAMGEDFCSAFALIELIEEQAKVNLMLRGKSR